MLSTSSATQFHHVVPLITAGERSAALESAGEDLPRKGAGYVYLSASSAMPGFVQLASCAEDPRGQQWSIQTMTGVTHFRTLCAVATSDCEAVEACFRAALRADQIPHHPDLFKIAARFAQQILRDEAEAYPPSNSGRMRAPRIRRQIAGWAAAAALAAVALVLQLAAGRTSPSPAASPNTPQLAAATATGRSPALLYRQPSLEIRP